MSLMELFSDYADKQNIVLNQCGNTGNMDVKSHVTAVDRVAVGGNTGNMGNIKNNTPEVNFKPVAAAVYIYRTTENPMALLTIVTQGKALDEARHILDNRYGDKLLSVEPIPTNPNNEANQ